MSKYIFNGLGKKIEFRKSDDEALEIIIGNQKAQIFTEDLAAIVSDLLPEDRARDLFAETETKAVQKGKVRVAVRARSKIEKGDLVHFTIDVARYLDKWGNPYAVRTTPSGIII